MSDIIVFKGILDVIREVFIAIFPVVVFFAFFQIFYLKLPRTMVINIIKGIILTFLGIVLFLQGVHVGFLPAGEQLGRGIAESRGKWFIIITGFILGMVATFAEPAVRALGSEVEKMSSGYIPQFRLLVTLSLGVGFSVSLAMARIIYGIPLMYLLIPGYGIALLLMFISKEKFVSIAFDSGGVATGPMAVTFVMAFSIGIASQIEGRNPLIDGFGMIALVALIPIISVLILGLIYKEKEDEIEKSIIGNISLPFSNNNEFK